MIRSLNVAEKIPTVTLACRFMVIFATLKWQLFFLMVGCSFDRCLTESNYPIYIFYQEYSASLTFVSIFKGKVNYC